MGILGKLFGGGMEDPAEGTAKVISRTDQTGRAIREMCRMNLVVTGDGLEPTAVEASPIVHRDRWPDEGTEIPVVVDRADPSKLEFKWDEVPTRQELAEAAAERMRREGGFS